MKPKVIGIGEFLWDVLPTGPRMGGAPANFACHAAALGAEAAVISRVGADESGGRLVRELAERGVSTDCITPDPDHPTGTVNVRFDESGKHVFEITADVAWDHIKITPALQQLVGTADALCFGTLGQRNIVSRSAIRGLLEKAPAGALKVFDANLRQNLYDHATIESSLALADVLKLSDEELPVISSMFGIVGGVREQLETLRSRHQLKLVVYTRGADGSVLTNGRDWVEHAAIPTTVRDTVGAGDSFTASVTMGFLSGWPLDRIARSASQIAAFVCSKDGAVPLLPQALREPFIAERLKHGSNV